MPMIVGDAHTDTGMAGAIYDALKALPSSSGVIDGEALKQLSNGIAQAVVTYIQTNAIAVGAMGGGPGVPIA